MLHNTAAGWLVEEGRGSTQSCSLHQSSCGDMDFRFPVEQQQGQRLQLGSPWTLVSYVCRFRAIDVFLSLN